MQSTRRLWRKGYGGNNQRPKLAEGCGLIYDPRDAWQQLVENDKINQGSIHRLGKCQNWKIYFCIIYIVCYCKCYVNRWGRQQQCTERDVPAANHLYRSVAILETSEHFPRFHILSPKDSSLWEWKELLFWHSKVNILYKLRSKRARSISWATKYLLAMRTWQV